MRTERDDGMRLQLLLLALLMMLLQARPCRMEEVAVEEVVGGWFCGGEGKLLERRCIGEVFCVTVW